MAVVVILHQLALTFGLASPRQAGGNKGSLAAEDRNAAVLSTKTASKVEALPSPANLRSNPMHDAL